MIPSPDQLAAAEKIDVNTSDVFIAGNPLDLVRVLAYQRDEARRQRDEAHSILAGIADEINIWSRDTGYGEFSGRYDTLDLLYALKDRIIASGESYRLRRTERDEARRQRDAAYVANSTLMESVAMAIKAADLFQGSLAGAFAALDLAGCPMQETESMIEAKKLRARVAELQAKEYSR